MLNIFKVIILTLTTFYIAIAPASADICRRHFYNNSNFPWSVQMLPPNGCGNGNIIGQTCLVRPHTSLALHYNSPLFGNTIRIWSRNYNNVFVTTPDCKIQHSGRTGNAYVNEPANGDVTTCSGQC